MLNLVFQAQREIIRFSVDAKVVKYYDKIWTEGIQIYPLDKKMVKSMIKSRKQSVSAMGLLIADANHGKNLKEYESCATDEEVAEIIRSDCVKKGIREVK